MTELISTDLDADLTATQDEITTAPEAVIDRDDPLFKMAWFMTKLKKSWAAIRFAVQEQRKESGLVSIMVMLLSISRCQTPVNFTD